MSAFKLYYTAHSCGAANYISAKLAGLTFDSEQVALATHKTFSGEDFYTINPAGNVPTIVGDNGLFLNQNPGSLTYIALSGDRKTPETTLCPDPSDAAAFGTFANALGFVNAELHGKGLGPLWRQMYDKEWDATAAKANAAKKIEQFEALLGDKKFISGDSLTVADIYAYICLSWSGLLGVTLTEKTQAFFDNIKADTRIQAAHEEMNAILAAHSAK